VKYRSRRSSGHNLIIAIVVVLLLMTGLAMAFQTNITVTAPELQLNVPELKPSEDMIIERQWGPLAPLVKSFDDFVDTLTGQSTSDVGLEAELGYTSTSGESVVFMQKFSGVGFLGMSGIYVKPKLGDYKALKLFDAERDQEGEVWVKPVIKIKAYNGEPEEYSFTTKIKVLADGELVDEKILSKAGKGLPPEKIEFQKVSVKGRAFHLLALGEKQLAKKLLKGEIHRIDKNILKRRPPKTQREICFYADYQGMIKFKEDEEPVVKELKNIKLGCFTFEFKETGDFEMIVEKNVTVAPLAEVITGAESGMGGLTPTIETTTITVTIPYTSYITTHLTTNAQGQVTTITQTITSYKTHTLTQVKTRWKTTTTTTTITSISKEVVTKTITVTKYANIYGPLAGVVITIRWPYSEYIFIANQSA